MAKQAIHTTMIGRRVTLNPASEFLSNPCGPQYRYHMRAGQEAEIVNVYLKDGSAAYDLLFADGKIEEAMYPFGFTIVAKEKS